jgi:hypothetical protein
MTDKRENRSIEFERTNISELARELGVTASVI